MKYIFIRWVMFLPLSFLSALIAGRLWDFLNEISFLKIGIKSTSYFYSIYSALTLGIVYGFVFVYTGAYIVPKFKKQIALSMFILLNIAYVYLYICYFNESFLTKLNGVLMFLTLVGSSYTAYHYVKGQSVIGDKSEINN